LRRQLSRTVIRSGFRQEYRTSVSPTTCPTTSGLPENKVSLGLVEGLNTTIRVHQRRAYGYRDKDDLKLKIVAAFLPPLMRSAEMDPL